MVMFSPSDFMFARHCSKLNYYILIKNKKSDFLVVFILLNFFIRCSAAAFFRLAVYVMPPSVCLVI
jgi:hypothetical protein